MVKPTDKRRSSLTRRPVPFYVQWPNPFAEGHLQYILAFVATYLGCRRSFFPRRQKITMKPILDTIVRLLETEVGKQARCAIADDGCPIESTLMGTRDGLLNLALTIVQIVNNYEKFLSSSNSGGLDTTEPSQPGDLWHPEEHAYWRRHPWRKRGRGCRPLWLTKFEP